MSSENTDPPAAEEAPAPTPKPADPVPAPRKRRKRTGKICDSCGAKCAPRFTYCPRCGVHLHREEGPKNDGTEEEAGPAEEAPGPRDGWEEFWTD